MKVSKKLLACLLVVLFVGSILKISPSRTFATEAPKLSNKFTAEQLTTNDYVNVIVELKDDPVITYSLRKKNEPTLLSLGRGLSTSDYEKMLTEKQIELFRQIKNVSPDAKLGYRYQYTYNGFALSIRGADLERISKLDLVRKIYPSKTYTVSDDVSNSVIGATNVWQQIKDAKGNPVDGTGIVIAIIDTGVDYTHPDLGGGFGPNYKVIGGYDFGDKDPDPMDSNGHGTHVAGIAAADGKIKGVAPKAKILAYKIVAGGSRNASTENIIAGIERAVKDGANVANLSFGSASLGTSDPEDPENKAFDTAADAGVLSSISAGNQGARCQTKPYPLGSPSGARKVLSVAASDDGIHPAINIVSPTVPEGQSIILGNYADLSPAFPKDQQFEVVVCGYGRPSDFEGVDVKGKIALVSRGPLGPNAIYFRDKDLNAKAAGAVGIIIYNNMPGIVSPTFNVQAGDEKKEYIPAIFVTQSDGLFIKDLINKGLKIKFNDVSNLGTIASFSSMGPSSDFYFKPEIAAPGVAIYSTIPGGAYASWNGTSMAAPHVAGAIALFKQVHPDFTSEDIKAALMNTAVVLKNYQNNETITWLLQGSGRLNIASAISTPATIKPYDILVKTDKLTPVTLTIKNVSGTNQTFSVSSEFTLGNSSGLTVNINPSKVTIAQGQSSTVTLTFSVDNSKLSKGPHEGLVWFDNGQTKLHVPFIIWNGDVEIPEKLYDVNTSSNVLKVGSNKIDFTFAFGSGSIIPPAEPNERPESSNIIDQVEIRVKDLNGNTLGVIYDRSLLFLGHYSFSWDGRDIYGNYFLKDGKYKWQIAVVESNNDQQNPIIEDTATVEGDFEVQNSPQNSCLILLDKQTIAQEETSNAILNASLRDAVSSLSTVISFNANITKAENVALGSSLKTDDIDSYSLKVDNLTGEIFVNIKFKQGHELKGNVSLVSFALRGKIPGTTQVGFKESNITNANGNSIFSVFLPTQIKINKAEKPWDLNRDKKVNDSDLALFKQAFGTEPKDLNYLPLADFNMDGIIDGKDLVILLSHFGETYP
ncbi:S8 family serine peptidase [Caldisericum exile]|uniref:S8 family peptidase n=1 Tax=Caldisericum exile (strain DSM 21853 / NBRC 104410 / AZM16c01) TaxID=511051 RepID=A0A7U6GG19_CALEA|nr:S8 family serine peptidase [Caldisericum exile]BAL81672.1 putative S8 family peptidase [Caldisericum exile AZM16c01]